MTFQKPLRRQRCPYFKKNEENKANYLNNPTTTFGNFKENWHNSHTHLIRIKSDDAIFNKFLKNTRKIGFHRNIASILRRLFQLVRIILNLFFYFHRKYLYHQIYQEKFNWK